RDAFIQTFGGDFANTTEALLVHKKATEVHATSLNMATMYLTQRAMPNVYAVTGKTERQKRKTKDDDVVVTATLEDLFTNMDYCACEHCNSIFSPAAYLVELLEFLDVDGLDPAN